MKESELKDPFARYRQIKVSVIGRKSGQTISIPDLGRTNDEQGVVLNRFFCIVFIQPVLLMIEPCACATTRISGAWDSEYSQQLNSQTRV